MITETTLWLKANWERIDTLRDRPGLPEQEREALERLLKAFEEQTDRIISLNGVVGGLLGGVMTKEHAVSIMRRISDEEIAVLKAARGESAERRNTKKRS